MATYYIHAQNGNDVSGDGSSGNPWATLDKIVTTAATGNTYYLAGTFRPDKHTDLRDKGDNISLLQWDGQAPCIIRGDTVTTGWTANANTYSKVIGTSYGAAGIASVVVDWDTSVDSEGRHYGHLSRVADAATCGSTNDSFFYDNTGSGTLYIRIGAKLDPAGFTVGRCIATVRAISMGSTTSTPSQGLLCRGLTFYLWSDSTAEYGYGLRYFTVQNSTMDSITCIDCGYHGTGWTNNNGTAALNNIESNTLIMGLGAGADSAMVMYADTGTMTNCRIYNSKAYVYPLLGRDGVTPAGRNGTSSFGAMGVICHAGSGNALNDFEARNCWVKGYVPTGYTNRTEPYRCANTADVAAADRLTWQKYPARFVKCVAVGDWSRMNWKSSGCTVNCSLLCAQSGAAGTAAINGAFGDNSDTGAACSIGHFGTEMLGNLDGGANTCWLYCARGDTSPTSIAVHTLINCTLYNIGTSTNNNVRGVFNQNYSSAGASKGSIYARGCIFGHATPTGTGPLNNLTHNNSSAPAADMDFKDCVYINIASTRYSSNTSYDADTEWASGIDPNGLQVTTKDPIAGGSAALNAAIKQSPQYVKWLPEAFPEGVNGREYSGHYGAWQYGKQVNRMARSGATVSNVSGALNAPRMSRGR